MTGCGGGGAGLGTAGGGGDLGLGARIGSALTCNIIRHSEIGIRYKIKLSLYIRKKKL
jgi:hypothetical protein